MLIGLLLAASAFVTETTLEMKTYPFSDPDPVPAVEKTRYPYFFFDGATTNGAPIGSSVSASNLPNMFRCPDDFQFSMPNET